MTFNPTSNGDSAFSAARQQYMGPQPDLRQWIRHQFGQDVNRVHELERELETAAAAPATRTRPARRFKANWELTRARQVANRRYAVAKMAYYNETDPITRPMVVQGMEEAMAQGQFPYEAPIFVDWDTRETTRKAVAKKVGQAIRQRSAIPALQRAVRRQRSQSYAPARDYRKTVRRVAKRPYRMTRRYWRLAPGRDFNQ